MIILHKTKFPIQWTPQQPIRKFPLYTLNPSFPTPLSPFTTAMAHRTSQRRTLATDPDSKASSMDPTNLLLLKRQQPKPSASQRQTIPNPDTIKPSSISLFSMSTTKNLSKSLNSDHRIGSYQKPTSQILHNSKPKGEKKKFFQVLQEKEGEKLDSLKGSKEVEEGNEKKKEKFGWERNLVVSSPSSLLPLAGGERNRRRSFCGSHVELADVFASNGVKVVLVDMPPLMQIHAVEFARKTHDSMEKFTSKTLALTLKKEFDGVYGPAWHCIVGTSFGSFVTHSVGGFLYFSMDQKLYILLFKTTVQRAD